MIPEQFLRRPPFRLDPHDDPVVTGNAIAECLDFFQSVPAPLETAMGVAMGMLMPPQHGPLQQAAMAIARDIDAGIGTDRRNTYHNAQHFCEVALCALYIGQLARLTADEHALVLVAALVHDFHHDGRSGHPPYWLERQSFEKALPYLAGFHVAGTDCMRLEALVLSTQSQTGVVFARRCYARHLHASGVKPMLPTPASLPAPPVPELAPLADDARLSLQAMVLVEADVLPSVGLTLAHADLTSARLEKELGTHLDSRNKIDFMDNCVGELMVANYFSPNLQRFRQTFLNRTLEDKTRAEGMRGD